MKLKANRSNESAENLEESLKDLEEESLEGLEEESLEDLVEESLEEESLEEDLEDLKEESLKKPQRIYKKTTKPSHSEGVDDINKLPLDWFTKVKYQKQKKNQNLV